MQQSIVSYGDVYVLAVFDICEYIFHHVAIFLLCLLKSNFLGVLLYAPYSPQHHIRLLYLIYIHGKWLAQHELIDAFYGGPHYHLEIFHLVYGECQAGQRDECIACANLKPWVAGKHVAFLASLEMELVGRRDECVVEVVAWFPQLNFFVEGLA